MRSRQFFPHRFLTSHLDSTCEQRMSPVGARENRNCLVVVRGDEVAVDPEGALWMPHSDFVSAVYLGEGDAGSIWAHAHGPDDEVPSHVDFVPLRQASSSLTHRQLDLALTAVGMLHWHAEYNFCAQCGRGLEVDNHGWELRCALGHLHFPRTDPAVIVAVTDDADRLLLARNVRFRKGFHSVLAGFVEPGEDFDTAARREVYEEVGLEIDRIEYRSSQPWPFPRSIMVAFVARVAAGAEPESLLLQDSEIVAARWFTRLELREAIASGEVVIPDTASIARALIDEWLVRGQHGQA